jgi:hypothetical protein
MGEGAVEQQQLEGKIQQQQQQLTGTATSIAYMPLTLLSLSL